MSRPQASPQVTAQRRHRSLEAVATDRLSEKQIATKQMGDACEMLVAAELTLAGVPAFKLPDNWPGCIFILPRGAADSLGYVSKNRPSGSGYGFFVVKLVQDLARYENNFGLAREPELPDTPS